MKRALISVLPLGIAAVVASLFLLLSATPNALVATVLGAIVVTAALSQLRGLRERPALAAGFVGLAAFVWLLVELRGLEAVGWPIAFALVVAIGSGIFFERITMMMPARPAHESRVFLTMAALLACASPFLTAPTRPEARTLGQVTVPALAASTRGRVGEVEVFTQPSTSREMIAIALRSGDCLLNAPCLLETSSLDRTLRVSEAGSEVVIDWSVSPHGEVFEGCTFDRESGAFLRAQPVTVSKAAERAPLFGLAFLTTLIAVLAATRLRRHHARIARSLEVVANEQGVVTMPDGSLAVLREPIHAAATLVALRISDRPVTAEAAVYRADARVIVEAWELGKKSQVLPAFARRIRTMELLGASAALFAIGTAWLIR